MNKGDMCYFLFFVIDEVHASLVRVSSREFFQLVDEVSERYVIRKNEHISDGILFTDYYYFDDDNEVGLVGSTGKLL